MRIYRNGRNGAMLIVFIMVAVILLPAVHVHATDQPQKPISTIAAPNNILFYGMAWNEDNYEYAIAGGAYLRNQTHTALFRYSPEEGWTNLTDKIYRDCVVHDVVYYKENSFFILADDGGESAAYFMEDANSSDPTMLDLSAESTGGGFSAGCYDPFHGSKGSIIAVGTPYDSTPYGMISWFDIGEGKWHSIQLNSDISLRGVACDKNASTSYFIAVGYDTSKNRGVAYLCDYKDVYPLQVPPDAAEFTSVSWRPGNESLLVVGYDTDGHGRMWKISNIKETIHIAYYDQTSGSEELRYVGFDGYSWHASVVDGNRYAGYYPSIALDHEGRPHISYWDGGRTHLKQAYFENNRWNIEEVDTSGNVGEFSSVAIDWNDNPSISYYDYSNKALKYAKYDGSSWNTGFAHSGGSSDVGKYTSLALDTVYNRPVIAYMDATNSTPMYSYLDGGVWHHYVVDNSGKSTVSYLQLCPYPTDRDDYWNLAYYDGNNNMLRYAYTEGLQQSWTTESVTSSDAGFVSMDLDQYGNPVIAYVDNDAIQVAEKNGGSWTFNTVDSGSGAGATSIKVGIYGDKFVLYHYSTRGLDLAIQRPPETSWSVYSIDTRSDAGVYNSMAIGVRADFKDIKLPSTGRPLQSVDWKKDGSLAIAVGDTGRVFVYYPGHTSANEWTDSTMQDDLTTVAVKSPGSPGYGLALGSSARGIVISYQMYNTATQVKADNYIPHINSMDILDDSGNSRLNKQSDVGSTYTFFMNCSYDSGWTKVGGLDIYAWYDFGSENITAHGYNTTKGKNFNFHLHFTPDSSDPVNNEGVWKLMWPNGTDELVLVNWYQKTEDRKGFAGSGPGSDEFDYFLLYVNVTFGEQMVYAPGQGWSPAGNQLDPSQAFNDINSWNFNITIYDKDKPDTAKETKYDEFGIYAYTEITVKNNPSGQGFPSAVVDLSPPTVIGVRANLPYYVKLNISDLVGVRNSSHKITRENVDVKNEHPDANSTNSEISTWRPFSAAGNGPFSVWGNQSSGGAGQSMPNLPDGTWSAGMEFGYSDSDVSTPVYWRIHIPPSTPDDQYQSTVVVEITY